MGPSFGVALRGRRLRRARTVAKSEIHAYPTLALSAGFFRMEIHKPRAAHKWREFFIEIGTITCGILIALALEQVIEQVNARHEAEVLDRALRTEVTRNLGEALQEASTFYCIRSQTAAAAARLAASGAWPGAKPFHPGLAKSDFGKDVFAAFPPPDAARIPEGVPPPAQGYAPWGGVPNLLPSPRSTLDDRAWVAAAASPGLLHMDQARRDRYALIYYHARRIEALIEDGMNVRKSLAALAYPQSLSEPERRRYLEFISALDGDNVFLYATTGLLISVAANNGVSADKTDLDRRLDRMRHVFGACVTPFVTPRRAQAWSREYEMNRERFGAASD